MPRLAWAARRGVSRQGDSVGEQQAVVQWLRRRAPHFQPPIQVIASSARPMCRQREAEVAERGLQQGLRLGGQACRATSLRLARVGRDLVERDAQVIEGRTSGRRSASTRRASTASSGRPRSHRMLGEAIQGLTPDRAVAVTPVGKHLAASARRRGCAARRRGCGGPRRTAMELRQRLPARFGLGGRPYSCRRCPGSPRLRRIRMHERCLAEQSAVRGWWAWQATAKAGRSVCRRGRRRGPRGRGARPWHGRPDCIAAQPAATPADASSPGPRSGSRTADDRQA